MIDYHVHTNMSYCAERGLTPEVYAEQIRINPELDAVYVTDHGMAVYFPAELAWSWTYMNDSRIFDENRDWGNRRLESHLSNLEKFRRDGIHPGMEVEMMHDGRITLDDSFRDKLEILIGSVHYLPLDVEEDKKAVLKEWKRHTGSLMNTGINVLGHPFRWISSQIPVTRNIIREVVREAKKAGVALELNGHYVVSTDIDMLQECVEQGVPLSIGSDSHAINEIADFRYHMETIEAAGLSLAEIRLFTPKAPSKTKMSV